MFGWHHRLGSDHVCSHLVPPSTWRDLPSLSNRGCVRISQGWLCFFPRCFLDRGVLLELLFSSAVFVTRNKEPSSHRGNSYVLDYRLGNYRDGGPSAQIDRGAAQFAI